MHDQTKKSNNQNHSKAIANLKIQELSAGQHCLDIVDNRPEAIIQRKFLALAKTAGTYPIGKITEETKNNSSLRNNLKTGIEDLPAKSMDDDVHEEKADVIENSTAPLQAKFQEPQLSSKPQTSTVVQRVGGQTSGYDPGSIIKPAFKEAVKQLFNMARKLNKIKKNIITTENNTKLSNLSDKAKGKQVKGSYALGLTTVNLDPQWLSNILTENIIVNKILAKAKDLSIIEDKDRGPIIKAIAELNAKIEVKIDEKKYWIRHGKRKKGGTRPEAKILVGKAAFVKKTDKDVKSGIHRDIYKNLGKEEGDNNEYVLDDFGNYTRRYAHMEKSYHQWMAFKEKGFLTGKTQDIVGAATGTSAKDVNPTDFENQKLTNAEKGIRKIFLPLKGDNPTNRKIALAYMHQWKGSGPGQRGLSLTSTAKEDAIYGNAGESFKSDEGAKFKIDLAKIDPTNNIMINHYSPDSPTRANLDTLGKDVSDRKLGKGSSKKNYYQYERSVIKNREIYLQKLTPEAVVSITPHESNIDIDRDSAIYKENKEKAIANFKPQQKIDQWVKTKSELQKKLNQENLNKQTAESDKEKASNNYKLSLQKKDGLHIKFKNDIQIFGSKVLKCTEEISKIEKEIVKGDADIKQYEKLLHTKPDGSNKHALKGWETGESYNEGYKAGLKAKQNTGSTNKNKINKLFSEAYKDKNKYTPYWEGYGAALNS